MPRTVDEAARARRREHFLDVTRTLIETRGYDRTSVQDVLDEARASRGAFYHYFVSKQELLSAVVDSVAGTVAATLDPIATDPHHDAVAKLVAVFAELSAPDLVRTLRVWSAEGNERVRQRARVAIVARLTGPLTAIVAQGVAEGRFTVPDPPAAAHLLATLTQDLNDDLADPTSSVDRTLRTHTWAVERLLGLPPGSLPGAGFPR